MNRKRCSICRKLTFKYQRVNGGAWHCYDGCYSTTGYDKRSIDGTPMWKGGVRLSNLGPGALFAYPDLK